jgi:hypothetical protein
MQCQLITLPTAEPISLSELKLHLRLDSGSLADNLDETQSITPGSHALGVGYALVGISIEVLGYQALVMFQSGTNGAMGTADVKIQDSDDNATWTDWTGGAFTQVTTANDNATYEKAYTGAKRYIRTVAKVLLAACEFGTTIIRLNPQSAEDDLLTSIIIATRDYVEAWTRRQLLTATWDYFPVNWPGRYGYRGTPSQAVNPEYTQNDNLQSYYIKLPFGNLQSVTSVKWKDVNGNETTLTENTDYIVETNGNQCGKIVLPWGVVWPTGMLYPSNPISIRYICGWTTAALVPYKIKAAIKMIAAGMYENREDMLLSPGRASDIENSTIPMLLESCRLWDNF